MLLTSACIVLGMDTVTAEQDGDFVYTVSEGKATITGYTGAGGYITIPSSVGGYTTVAIGQYAFNNGNSLISVTIPSSVAYIGLYAFADCKYMTSVIIPEGVKSIDWYAFIGCISLSSITLPSTLVSIGNNAFQRCTSLTSAVLPSNMVTVTKGIFTECTSLASITIPSSVEVIKDYAFESTALTSIVIPSSVSSIEYAAFANCPSLEAIYFKGNAPSIGANWVYNHNLDLTLYYYEGASGFTTPTWDGVKTVALPADLDYRTMNANSEVEITGYHGSGGAVIIPSVIEGKPVTSIGDRAFYYCDTITSVSIPEGITHVGDRVFDHCTSLTSVMVPSTVTTMGISAFEGCTSMVSANIPNGITTIPAGLFMNCYALASITIPDTVVTIGDYAFYSCAALTKVDIPDSVTSIGDCAFAWGLATTSINVGSGNQNYASVDGVLYDKDLTTLIQYPVGRTEGYTIPSTVTTIGRMAFANCQFLTSFTIPDGVTTIKREAFQYCTALTSVTVPESVTNIEYAAFAYCWVLNEVHFEGNAPSLGESFVYSNDPSLVLYYYEGATGYPTDFNGIPFVAVPAPPPSVTITSPTDGSFTKSTAVTTSWSATDQISGIAYFMVKMDNGRWIQVTGNSYTFAKLKTGMHTVTVQAFNNAGLSTTASSMFTIDVTTPTLRITSPIAGATVPSGTVTVQWSASDSVSGIAYYMVKLDSGAWVRVDDVNSYTFTGVANGKHTVSVQVVDNAGNAKTAMVKFTVRA